MSHEENCSCYTCLARKDFDCYSGYSEYQGRWDLDSALVWFLFILVFGLAGMGIVKLVELILSLL